MLDMNEVKAHAGHALDDEYSFEGGLTNAHCWSEWDIGVCPHEEAPA